MATKEELWNEIEELALEKAKEILAEEGTTTKEKTDIADRLVYIATSVETGTTITIKPADLQGVEPEGANLLYSMTKKQDGTVEIRPGYGACIRLCDERQVQEFIHHLLDLCHKK